MMDSIQRPRIVTISSPGNEFWLRKRGWVERMFRRRLLMVIPMTVGLTTLTVFGPCVISASSRQAPSYYLSLGDSLAEGYQPGSAAESVTLHGYSNQVVTDLGSRKKLVLENFACGGITTTQLMKSVGCPTNGIPLDGAPYSSTTQLAAAVDFIFTHVSSQSRATAIGILP